MTEEPMKNEQDDQSFLNRRGPNTRSRRNPAPAQTPDSGKKQIPSFEEIIAEQQETEDIPTANPVEDIDSDDHIDPLESLNELKSAISKTQANLSSEEIDGLLGDQQIDNIEEDHSIEDNNAGGFDAEDEMDALASLKAAIQQAQSQLDQDDLNDGDKDNTGSFHIGGARDDQPPVKPENENSMPKSNIPSFELTEKILTEQRKTAAARRTRKSENTQKSDRSDITGILGEVVRAGREVASEPEESFSIGPNIAGDRSEDTQEQAGLCDVNDRYTPVVYSFLRGEDNLSQIQRVIIADIVARDLAKQWPQPNALSVS